jgi:hypothetical protein
VDLINPIYPILNKNEVIGAQERLCTEDSEFCSVIFPGATCFKIKPPYMLSSMQGSGMGQRFSPLRTNTYPAGAGYEE